MTKRKFINNFIMIDADSTVKDALKLIKQLSPEYVIINRIKNGIEYHYAYKPEFFYGVLQINGKSKRTELSDLTEFLKLQEWKAHDVLSTNLNTDDPAEDMEIKDLSKNTKSDKATIIYKNNVPVGLLEPNKISEEVNIVKKEIRKLKKPAKENQSIASSLTRGSTRGGLRGSTRGGLRGSTRGGLRGSTPITTRGGTKKVKTVRKTILKDKPKEINKFATGTLPNTSTIGDQIEFKITIKNTAPANGKSGKMTLKVDNDKKNTELWVMLQADPSDFVEFVDKQMKKIEVPTNKKNSNPISFKIKPKKEGWCSITAQFMHDGNMVSEIISKTKINKKETPSKLITSISDVNLTQKLSVPDLKITIIEDKIPNEGYQFRILADLPIMGLQEIFESHHLTKKAEEIMIDQVQDLDEFGYKENKKGQLVRDKGISDKDIEDHATDQGKILYTALFPEKFRKIFWKNKDNIKSIQIRTKEPLIPWEIIKPWNQNNGKQDVEPFLCEKYAMSRWWDGIQQKQKTKIKKIKIVQPKDTNLDGAKLEAKWIEDYGKEKNITVNRAETSDKLKQSLKKGDFDLLHISTHGKYDEVSPLRSYIELEKNKEFRASSVVGNSAALEKSNPLIVMNACETGVKGFGLAGMDGWATTFLNADAYGFVGTLWSIGDKTAQKFTKSLYKLLDGKMNLDEAVRQSRIKAKRKGDASWLSYTLYSPSNTSIKIGN